MKFTESALRQVIREELLREAPQRAMDRARELWGPNLERIPAEHWGQNFSPSDWALWSIMTDRQAKMYHPGADDATRERMRNQSIERWDADMAKQAADEAAAEANKAKFSARPPEAPKPPLRDAKGGVMIGWHEAANVCDTFADAAGFFKRRLNKQKAAELVAQCAREEGWASLPDGWLKYAVDTLVATHPDSPAPKL